MRYAAAILFGLFLLASNSAHAATPVAITCNYSSADQTAIAAAVTAGSAISLVSGNCLISSALTINTPVEFVQAQLKPASGIVVTLGSTISAAAQQICDISSGGHCDFTNSAPVAGWSYPEWWGVMGGDTSFNSSHATANGPLIDEAISYAPFYIAFVTPGIYSTTGHYLAGTHSHHYLGLGKSFTGTGGILNGIICSGIPFAYASQIASGDPANSDKYCFQSGATDTGRDTVFDSISIGVSDLSNTWPLGILANNSTTSDLNWRINVMQSALIGRGGLQGSNLNGNSFRDNFIGGRDFCVALTVPNDYPFMVNQKVEFSNNEFSQTQNSSGTCIYESISTSSPGANMNILWASNRFEYGYNLFHLDANGNVFLSPHYENWCGAILTKSGTDTSSWVNPVAAGRCGDPPHTINTLNALYATNGSTDSIIGTSDMMLAGHRFVATSGTPEGSVFGALGDIAVSNASQPNILYLKTTGSRASPTNTGWSQVPNANWEAFSANLGSSVPNATGDGTNFEIPYGGTSYNVSNGFGSQCYTAATAQLMHFDLAVDFYNIGMGHINGQVFLESGSQTIRLWAGNPYAVSAGTEATLGGSTDVQMSAGETMCGYLNVTGIPSPSTKTITVSATNGGGNGHFTGHRIR